MSSTDKAKLDGIASGANNYKLPTASENTLGGIKATSGISARFNWPICVYNGSAYAVIDGLYPSGGGEGGGINRITTSDENNNRYRTDYHAKGITVDSINNNGGKTISFPLKSGTFALTSDLSDLCRFNFVNSISECRSDRINFLLNFSDYLINLDPFDSYPDGTILLITTN